jgi:hypothetical protein
MTVLQIKLANSGMSHGFRVGDYDINIVAQNIDLSTLDSNQLGSLLLGATSGTLISVGQTQSAFVSSINGQTPATTPTGSSSQSVSLVGNPDHLFLLFGPYTVTTTPSTVYFSGFSRIELDNIIIEIEANRIQAATLTQAQFIAFIQALPNN